MPLEEKRWFYLCGNDYVTLDQVLPWPDYVKENHCSFPRRGTLYFLCYFVPLKPYSTLKNLPPPLNSPLFIKPPPLFY
jgi:hypothetical protein